MTRWRIRDDDGVSLLESLVAITIVGIVMTAVAVFFVQSISAAGQQRGKQIATHLADSGMERVRALKGSAVTDGRIEGDASPPPVAVATMLANTTRMNLPSTVGAPVLPVVPETVTVAGTTYLRNWYVGACALPETGTADSEDDTCVATKSTDTVTLFRVVVAITWFDRNCTDSTCLFATSTLISSEPDEPVFNENEAAPPPVIEYPGDLTDDTVTAVDRTFAVSGDATPLTVSGDNLPDGLILQSSGKVTGTPTKAGTFAVVVRVTDIRGRIGSASFTWTISAPILTAIANQTTLSGSTVSLQVVNAGTGVGALTWSVTGPVPAGITFDTSTGLFSGSPTTTSLTTPNPPSTVMLAVRITDSKQQFSEVSFTWTVTDWSVPTIGDRSSATGTPVDYTLPVTGGRTPITWSAVNLPDGLVLDVDTGRIIGDPTTNTTYDVTVTARDTRDETRSASFVWTIT